MAVKQTAFVTLTLAHRDAVYEEIAFVFDSARQLSLYLTASEHDVSDRQWTRDLAERFATAVRLLDQLGWHERGDRLGYVLEVDADIARFMERLEGHATDALEDGRWELASDDWSGVDRPATIRQIDIDLDALNAARLVQAAYREAVAR